MKALFIATLCVAGLAQASQFTPSWTNDNGSAYAEFYDWNSFATPSAVTANEFGAFDPSTGTISSDINGMDRADVISSGVYTWFDNGPDEPDHVLNLLSSDTLSFWMPTFSGFETTEAVIQLTYWDDNPHNGGHAAWRAGLDLMPQLSDTSSGTIAAFTYLGEYHDIDGTGKITEAWKLTIDGSTDGLFADITFDNDLYLDSAVIDTVSYDAIPEPASIAFMLTGGVFMALIRKKLRI